jgi:predicted flap endonuclease-1-like 5' DNA nuclease
MTSLISLNAVPIVVALLIGLVVGWWVFKRGGRAAGMPAASDHRRASSDGPEPNGLAAGEAAAVADIAGELLGADVHAELPSAKGPPDDLQMMKGVGAKLAARLNEVGIARFDQLAALTPAQAETLDARMDQFKGRLFRDRMIEQAGYLARDDRAGFETTFGNLGKAATTSRS